MTLEKIAQNLGLKLKTETGVGEVKSGYASDLLSDVLANAKNATLWVTNHKHVNIIGVAVMLNLAGVVIAGGIEPDAGTIEKAKEEKIPLYTTDLSLYEVVGRMYELGIRSC
ncbi:MAG: serine kinase [Armatimonadetes bacterium]|jgi:hypothetical protein|nr:serine kinase [Armatimonadota bacterium]